MSPCRITRFLLPALGALALLPAGAHAAARPLPLGWPAHLVLGMSDQEHGAADLRATTRLEARYHYLAGGVNTGQGWTTWAGGGGSFVAGFIADSQASGFLPVFSLYQLRPSLPGAGCRRRVRGRPAEPAHARHHAGVLHRAADVLHAGGARSAAP